MESILVVDDSKTQLFTISLLLKKEGYIFYSEKNPNEARSKRNASTWSCAICRCRN
jgi:CheY-like chemotaxis protein